ncbi:phage late control D family protein [Roseateles sp. P5_E4]
MPPETSERPVSSRTAYSARPTLRVDGQALPALDDLVRTFSVTEAEGGMSSLSLGMGNWGMVGGSLGLVFDAGGPIKLGARVQLYAGETAGPTEIFDGQIHAIEASGSVGAPPSLLVLAEDKLFAARMKRRSKSHVDSSLEDVVRAIAGDHGLTVDASGLPGGTGLWVQLNESDLSFLRRLLGRCDCEMQVVGSTLQVRSSADMDRGTLDLTLYSQLQEVRVIADLSSQVTEVMARGFDPAAGSDFTKTSTGAQPGPGSGRTGASLLTEIGIDRSENLGALPCRNDTEAQALADAAFDQRARQFVRLHGRTEGNAGLRVGSRVNLHGVGRRFDNCYAVVEARHRFDPTSGYVTEFVAQSAFIADN